MPREYFDENEHTEIDNGIINQKILKKVISRISYASSCIDLDWSFDTQEVYQKKSGNDLLESMNYTISGWLIRTTFKRPDTNTGKIGIGHGRWEFIEFGASADSAIKTCWVLLEMIIKHELMEMFQVDGVRIFNPHKSIKELKDK